MWSASGSGWGFGLAALSSPLASPRAPRAPLAPDPGQCMSHDRPLLLQSYRDNTPCTHDQTTYEHVSDRLWEQEDRVWIGPGGAGEGNWQGAPLRLRTAVTRTLAPTIPERDKTAHCVELHVAAAGQWQQLSPRGRHVEARDVSHGSYDSPTRCCAEVQFDVLRKSCTRQP